MNWYGEELIKEGDYGFIYIIKHIENGRAYVGKKNLQKYKTINKKKVYSESNWKNYWGSNKDFLEYVKQEGKDMFKRYILKVCKSSKSLTYYEIHYQCSYNVLTNEKFFNSNILGKFFRRDLV